MKKILIVDDSKAMRMLVTRSLRQAGYGDCTFLEAADGQQGLGVIRAEQPDLVLCDWNMPNMLGIDLLKAVRAEGCKVTFGFVTSEVSESIKQQAKDAGAAFMISKPFTSEAVKSALSVTM
ncbi:MAG: response regulator [Myxococcales bacterium]|jgi:two-component system chemotaxis response regulator CheY|nr:response regulator [Myxococcales bacterium]